MFPERVGRVILDGVLDATRIASTQSYHVRLSRRLRVMSVADVESGLDRAAVARPGYLE